VGIFDNLKKVFLDACRDEHAVEPTLEQRADTADSAEMLAAIEAEPEPLLDGLSVGVTYQDMDGNVSERLVNCLKLVRTPEGTFLWGYCHLRMDFRAFRLDRIQEIRDYRTGAQTKDAEAFFAPFVTQPEPSPEPSADETDTSDYESRATREVHYNHGRVLAWMRGQVPSFAVLERAVDRLAARGEWELRALWDLSKDIVHADEHVDEKEVLAMDDLYNAIDTAIKEQRDEAG